MSEELTNASKRGRLLGWLFGLFAVAALAAAVLHFGDLRIFLQLARRAQPFWLLAALALQCTTYASVAAGWRAVLRRAGSHQPLRALLPIALSKLFADQVLPTAGMGGNVLLIDRLAALGVPRGTAVAALLVSMIGFYAAYSLFAVAMLVLLWLHDKATPLLAGLVTTFLLAAIAIPSLALWLRRRGSRPLSPALERVPVVRSLLRIVGEAPAELIADRRLILRVAGYNGLILLADAATLQVCLLALGQSASYGTAFIALMAASIVVTLGPLPLGLGSFEASATATLSLLGIPVEAAFAGTMLLRSFTLWLPLIPGLVLMRTSTRRKPRPARGVRRPREGKLPPV
jgi:uncharacterized membrane protein YbhN (UPF0104 family)